MSPWTCSSEEIRWETLMIAYGLFFGWQKFQQTQTAPRISKIPNFPIYFPQNRSRSQLEFKWNRAKLPFNFPQLYPQKWGKRPKRSKLRPSRAAWDRCSGRRSDAASWDEGLAHLSGPLRAPFGDSWNLQVYMRKNIRTFLNVFFSSIWSRTDFFTDIFWMGKIRLDIQTFFSSFVADMMEYKGMFWDVYVSIWMDDGPKLMGNWDNPCSWKADRSPMPMVKIRIPSCSMRIFQVHLGHLSHLGQLCSRMGSRKKLMEVALIQRWKTPQRGNSLDWNLWSPWTKVPPSQLQRRM